MCSLSSRGGGTTGDAVGGSGVVARGRSEVSDAAGGARGGSRGSGGAGSAGGGSGVGVGGSTGGAGGGRWVISAAGGADGGSGVGRAAGNSGCRSGGSTVPQGALEVEVGAEVGTAVPLAALEPAGSAVPLAALEVDVGLPTSEVWSAAAAALAIDLACSLKPGSCKSSKSFDRGSHVKSSGSRSQPDHLQVASRAGWNNDEYVCMIRIQHLTSRRYSQLASHVQYNICVLEASLL